jgi:hypothetical protein
MTSGVANSLAGVAQLVNITSLVSVRLDMFSTAYRRWKRLFLVVLGRFNLRHHIDGTPAQPNDAIWIQEDLTVLMWIHATLADDLLDFVMEDDITACGVWNKIADYFLGNKASHAVQLEQELHGLVQGDLSATAYCHKLKTLADSLADCDQPVKDRALVHQLIRGLNPKYQVLRQMLPAMPTFPTFMEARDQLIVAENTLASPTTTTQDTALTSTEAPTDANNDTVTSRPRSDAERGQSFSSSRGRGRGGSRGRGRGRGGRGTGRGNGSQWPQNIPPWIASLLASAQAWRAPWTGATGPGVLGARPPAGQAYNTNFAQPTTQFAPSAPTSFDTTGLLQALHAATQQHAPSQQDWYMDSGASGHMSADSGTMPNYCPSSLHNSSNIIVGNGSTLPIKGTGSVHLPTPNAVFHLSRVLHIPSLIKNLISVRKFTTDNCCSVEFDPFGFTIKDLLSRLVIMRSNSSGDLYPFFDPRCTTSATALTASLGTLWHRRLGHPGSQCLGNILSEFSIPVKNNTTHLCDAC